MLGVILGIVENPILIPIQINDFFYKINLTSEIQTEVLQKPNIQIQLYESDIIRWGIMAGQYEIFVFYH